MDNAAISDKPAEPGRYGFGTTEAIDSILQRIIPIADNTLLVAINVATLIRNAIGTKDAKAITAVEQVRQQISGISNELIEICNEKWKDRRHHILFYLADSIQCVPEQYRRISNGEAAAACAAAEAIYLKSTKSGDQSINNVDIHLRVGHHLKIPPYKGIRECINKMTQAGVDLRMISHDALDYHVCLATGRVGYLHRSHTGGVVKMTPSELGKIVFKNEFVPFYPKTHVLFGDVHRIKSSLQRKDKTRFVDLARRGRWVMNTESYIALKIKENNFPLPYSLD